MKSLPRPWYLENGTVEGAAAMATTDRRAEADVAGRGTAARLVEGAPDEGRTQGRFMVAAAG